MRIRNVRNKTSELIYFKCQFKIYKVILYFQSVMSTSNQNNHLRNGNGTAQPRDLPKDNSHGVGNPTLNRALAKGNAPEKPSRYGGFLKDPDSLPDQRNSSENFVSYDNNFSSDEVRLNQQKAADSSG